MDLSLAYSPCPNDTFIFYALSHARINSGNLRFTTELADVEKLNQMATENGPDITKLSYHAWAHVSQDYQLLTAGGAMGTGNGPILVSKQKIYPDEIQHATIAIPGLRTTAYLLLQLAFPGVFRVEEYLFSDIPEVVASGQADLGLIIHETRFQYKKMGLNLICDLGDWWENKTRLPIPLGGIAIRRDLPVDIKLKVNNLIIESILYSQSHISTAWPFISKNAAELSEDIILRHIKMFVNDYSLSVGKKGKKAMETLFLKASELENFPKITKPFFVESKEDLDNDFY